MQFGRKIQADLLDSTMSSSTRGPNLASNGQYMVVGLFGCLLPRRTMKTIWEFPKIRGTLIWGPYNENPTI